MVDVQSEIGFTSLFSLHVESSRECYVAKERLSRARTTNAALTVKTNDWNLKSNGRQLGSHERRQIGDKTFSGGQRPGMKSPGCRNPSRNPSNPIVVAGPEVRQNPNLTQSNQSIVPVALASRGHR